MTIYRALHPRSNVNRLYIRRKDGGRGLISIEDCVNSEKNNLAWYIKESVEPLLREVHMSNLIGIEDAKHPKELKSEISIEHKSGWREKNLHGKMMEAVGEFIDEELTWKWLKKGNLKKETEGMICAAQEQALRTNSIKHTIDKQNISPLCRMCGKWPETVAHITSECQQLAGKEYKFWRHNQVAQIVHWKLCQKYGFEFGERWYNHNPESVLENKKTKILWDFKIQTDHVLEHNRPDILVLDKELRTSLIIDIACPFDTRVPKKEKEKMDNYQDLKHEIRKDMET